MAELHPEKKEATAQAETPLEKNPLLIQVEELLTKSEEAIRNNDKRKAIEYYLQAKKISEDNELPEDKTIERFYALSVAIDK